MKRTLAVVSSHYAIDLEVVNDGYIVDEEGGGDVEEQIQKLVEAAEQPGTALARLFEDEVAPASSDDKAAL